MANQVEIYRRVNGMKFNKAIATHFNVQRALDEASLKIGVKAETFLDTRSKHRTGESKIEVSEGKKVDRFVSLVDKAAGAIEYGRYRDNYSRGIYALLLASGKKPS